MGTVHIAWYATGFRADQLEAALSGIAPIAIRYGARSYEVHRFRDDRYKFLQTAVFETKLDFDRYWHSPEFSDFRVLTSSWYQVPVLYNWSDVVASGTLETEEPERETSGVAGAEQGSGATG